MFNKIKENSKSEANKSLFWIAAFLAISRIESFITKTAFTQMRFWKWVIGESVRWSMSSISSIHFPQGQFQLIFLLNIDSNVVIWSWRKDWKVDFNDFFYFLSVLYFYMLMRIMLYCLILFTRLEEFFNISVRCAFLCLHRALITKIRLYRNLWFME